MKRRNRKRLRVIVPLAAMGAGVAAAALAVRRSRRGVLAGQVVLITGGSRGLGLALAREFAARGCRIAICARDEDHLDAARGSLEAEGTEVFAVPCDVSDRDRVNDLIAAVRARYGRIDILVNNAGIIRVAPLENTSIGDFEQAMAVMFWGVVYPSLAVLPEMMQRGSGHIAIVTSIGGKVSVPHLLAYSCAKFAAVGFCEGLRAEVARHGVRVTAIVPGLMRTGSHRNALFGGKSRGEAGWFGVGASLPLLAMNADRAARKIVDAIRCSKAERILTLQARLLSTLHGVSPGLVTDVLGGVNRLLPSPSGDGQTMRGAEAEEEMPRWWKAATIFDRRAAEDLNQFN